jgi:cell wall-associated NlpC family hydrolase
VRKVRCRAGRVGLGALVVLVVAGLVPVGVDARSASADPLDDKLEQARAVQDQIQANNDQVAVLAEQYNQLQFEFEHAQEAATLAEERLAVATKKVERLQGLIDERAAVVYRRTLGGKSLDGFDLNDGDHNLSRRQYAAAQAEHDNTLVDRLRDEQREMEKQRGAAEAAKAEVVQRRGEIEATRQFVEAATAEQQRLFTQIQGELLPLVMAEQARRSADDLESAQALYAPGSLGDGAPEMFPNLPPPSRRASIAIAFALAQLGKPYLYAASGPDSFDCSGLVKAAYAAAGISLVHYSGAQYAALPHVPLTAMLPGDLVFWGPAASKHVAIYVGAGRILEAGGTAHNVHIGPIWGRPMGAARPG